MPAMPASRSCPQCGAVVDLPEERLSGTCAFCRSPLVLADASRQDPDLVAPFVLDRTQAAARLKRFLQGKRWAPDEIRSLAPEKVEGVLTPFWIHDAIARSAYTADVGAHYYVTVGHGKNRRRERRTEWFPVQGTHVSERAGHLVSASRGLPEREANELEPFDLGALGPYEPARVAGWISERATVSREQALATAVVELENAETASIERFLPGDEARGVVNRTTLSDVRVRLALLPIWVATFRHGSATLRLLVNGQTGEVVGDVPVSRGKILRAVLVPLGILALLALLLWLGSR